MAYTPELSKNDSATVRRIAWALGIPMTRALPRIIEHAARVIDPGKVCEKCRDRSRCTVCVFKPMEVR